MIITAGALSGILISRRITNRILFFEQLLVFITELEQRLKYTLSSLSELLCSEQKMMKELVSSISGNLERGGIKSAAENAVNSLPHSCGLSGEDKELVIGFFSSLGNSDCEGQTAHCELYISLVKQLLSSQREEALKKSKLTRLLGIFAGIGVGLFFL